MSFTITTKLTGHEVIASCLPGFRSTAALSGAFAMSEAAMPRERVDERPTQAPAVLAAAAAHAAAYAANGAGHQLFGQQKTQLHSMWALRGLDPWSDPA